VPERNQAVKTERNSSRKITKGRAFQSKLESLSKWLIFIK